MTTQTMLGTTVYGEPSGNYDGSSQDWFSDAVTAANYYQGRGSVQTVTFSTTDFVGIIYLEGCLDQNPAEANWFDTGSFGSVSPITVPSYPLTITGNFTWMRLRVENFSSGTINPVYITY